MAMKLFAVLALGLGVMVSSIGHATVGTCEEKAAKAVVAKFGQEMIYETDDGGLQIRIFEKIECDKNASPVKCEIWMSNGEGAGDMTFAVTLNAGCSRVISSQLTGME